MFDHALGLLWSVAASVSSCTLLSDWLRNSTFSVFLFYNRPVLLRFYI